MFNVLLCNKEINGLWCWFSSIKTENNGNCFDSTCTCNIKLHLWTWHLHAKKQNQNLKQNKLCHLSMCHQTLILCIVATNTETERWLPLWLDDVLSVYGVLYIDFIDLWLWFVWMEMKKLDSNLLFNLFWICLGK